MTDDSVDLIRVGCDNLLLQAMATKSALIETMAELFPEQGYVSVLISGAINTKEAVATGGNAAWINALVVAACADLTNAERAGLFNMDDHSNVLDAIKVFAKDAKRLESWASKPNPCAGGQRVRACSRSP